MAHVAQIVVGIDGSDAATEALRWTVERHPEPWRIAAVHAGKPSDPVDNPCDVVESYVVRSGPAAEILLEVAAEYDAGLIVIGAHGTGKHPTLGSVARHLLHHSTVPVLVVDGTDEPRALEARPPVVAAIGYGTAADAASHWAAGYAAARDLPLVLLHTVGYRPVFPLQSATDMLASYLGPEVPLEWAQEELDARTKQLAEEFPDLEMTTHVDTGSTVHAVQVAGETAELIVLGKRHGDGFLSTLITPRLARLVARTEVPTVVVPTVFEAD